jgi:O-antigen/teichoic acid export membrane protein
MKKLSNSIPNNSLTKKATLNAFATALDYVARITVSFIINPLLLTGLGDFGYGAWQVLGRLIGYIGPAGGRPTQALKWTIANQQASTDYDEKRRQVGSAITVWFMFLPLLALLGSVLTWYAPNLLHAPLEAYPNVRWAAALLVANLIFTDLALIPQSVLRGENLGYKRMGLSTVVVFVGGMLTASALYLKTGLIGVAAADLVATAINGLLFLKVVRSHVAWFGVAKPLFGAVREYLGLSGWFLLWTLVMQLLKAGDVVVLGLFDSAELVTRYSLTKYIPETIIGFVAIVVFSVTPGLGGIIGSGDLKKATRVRNEMMIFTWFIVTVCGSTMLLWNQSFVQLWIGEEYYAGKISNLLIVLMVTQFVFIRNDANIIDLTLNLRQKVLIGILSAGLSVGISALLVGEFKINIPAFLVGEFKMNIPAFLAGEFKMIIPGIPAEGFKIDIPEVLAGGFKMGIVGVTLGYIAGQSVLSFSYPVLVGRFLGLSMYSQFKGLLRPVFITLLFLGAVLARGDIMVVQTWFGLVLSAGATVGLLALLAFYGGLNCEQRQSVIGRLRKVVKLK